MRAVKGFLGAVIALTLSAGAHAAAGNDALDSDVLALGDTLMLPAPDMAKIELEDSKYIGGPYRYGVQIPLRGKSAAGKWSRLDDGRMRYALTVASPGATSLDFHFGK